MPSRRAVAGTVENQASMMRAGASVMRICTGGALEESNPDAFSSTSAASFASCQLTGIGAACRNSSNAAAAATAADSRPRSPMSARDSPIAAAAVSGAALLLGDNSALFRASAAALRLASNCNLLAVSHPSRVARDRTEPSLTFQRRAASASDIPASTAVLISSHGISALVFSLIFYNFLAECP